MRRFVVLIGGLVLVVAIVVGCGSGAAVPTGLPGLGAATPEAPCPPLTRDPVLEAVFPDEIDGQPVANVESGKFLESVCVEGGQAGVDAVSSAAPRTVDLAQVFIASAEANVEATPLRIGAFRVQDATEDELRDMLAGLAQSVGGDAAKFAEELPDVQAGGKTVQTWTNAEGESSYLYWIGDIVVVADAVTASQADRIFAAFP